MIERKKIIVEKFFFCFVFFFSRIPVKYLITKNRVVSNFGEKQVEAKDTRRARLGAEATHVGAAKCSSGQGPVSQKSRKRFGREKPSVKLPIACFGNPIF